MTATPGGITPVGDFANVRVRGEHADGYSVRLWSSAGTLIGVVTAHRGLHGDAPIGVLSDVEHDRATGALAFRAKLTTGVHFSRTHQVVPSRDVLSFRGRLAPDRLEGTIVLESHLESPPAVVDRRERFVMPRDAGASAALRDYPDERAWRHEWEPIVKLRGPRW